MTVDEALRQASKALSPHSSTPRLDAEVLLSHVLGHSRARLLASYSDQIDAEQETAYRSLVTRRSRGEPVAYLTGHKEFYGFDLVITAGVLVPRPETESVVDACLEALPLGEPRLMADIGTGSGAIVVAVCAQRPLVTAYATDISPEALAAARANCERLGLGNRVTILQGDLLEPLPGPVDVLAANLPYASPGEASPEVATWEPHVAVYGGGEDGTVLIRRFMESAPRYLNPGGRVVMETAYSQGSLTAALARERFPGAAIEVRRDLAGYERVVVISA